MFKIKLKLKFFDFMRNSYVKNEYYLAQFSIIDKINQSLEINGGKKNETNKFT